MSLEQRHRSQGDVDQAFSVLAAPERRIIVGFLQKTDHGAVSVEGLAEVCNSEGIENGDSTTTDYLVTTLRHQHLPKLADAGIVEFDRESGQVRYEGDRLVEELLKCSR